MPVADIDAWNKMIEAAEAEGHVRGRVAVHAKKLTHGAIVPPAATALSWTASRLDELNGRASYSAVVV
jgi:hypothetical protein